MHIAIAGNIGSGKTTLTKLLVKRYGWTPRFEPVETNPYLDDFYQDMNRWSFNLQVYFLNKRFRDVVEISKSTDTIIQDRTIFEDARIFAPNLHAQGYMEPHRPDCQARQGVRAKHTHRLPHRTERALRGVDKELPRQAPHRRWRHAEVRVEHRRLPAHHRANRRKALRPLPGRVAVGVCCNWR